MQFEYVFSQSHQFGLQIGRTNLKEIDTYLEAIIDGSYNKVEDNFFESGYIFYKKSYNSWARSNIQLNYEYKLSSSIHPFLQLTYFRVISNGNCQVMPLFSGGLMEQETGFEVKSDFLITQLGLNFNNNTRYLIPFLSLNVIYNMIRNRTVQLLDVNDDFMKYSHKYTFDIINNIGLGLGVGIKIPIFGKLQLLANAEYDDLNLFYSEVNKFLIFNTISIGAIFKI